MEFLVHSNSLITPGELFPLRFYAVKEIVFYNFKCKLQFYIFSPFCARKFNLYNFQSILRSRDFTESDY